MEDDGRGKAKIPGGFILLARKLLDSGIWEREPGYLRFWFYLLLKARWSETPDVRGGITVGRGELLKSFREIQRECRWQENQRWRKWSTGKIHHMVDWLESAGMIYTRSTNLGTHFKIRNYAEYQDVSAYALRTFEQTSEHPSNNNKKVEEGKAEEIHVDESTLFSFLLNALGEEVVVREAMDIPNLDLTEAEWLVQHFLDKPGGCFGEYVEPVFQHEVARALHDMARKAAPWKRETFVSFLASVYSLENENPSGDPDRGWDGVPDLAVDLFLNLEEAFSTDGLTPGEVYAGIVARLNSRSDPEEDGEMGAGRCR